MTIWQDAAAMLSGNLKSCSNESLLLTRGNNVSSFTGSFGTTEAEALEAGGQITEWHTDDVVCDTADYQVNGAAVLPLRGDKIARTLPSGDVIHYEVHHPSPNKRPYKLSCQDLRLRIHCKRVST